MEIGPNTRRRLSGTPNINDAGSYSDEAIPSLLGDSDNTADKSKESLGEIHSYGDSSKWLRPLCLIFAVLFLATVLFSSSFKVFWPHVNTRLAPPYGFPSAYDGSQAMLGIQLHPEDHVSRPAQTMTHYWNITAGFRSPDGVKKEVYLVNDLFPGPTVECRSGDKLIVHVTNSLVSEGVSIHWHGLEMRSANAMDGAAGFTQCPISAGESFTYEFLVRDEAGTFWWHAHSQVQRGDGMYGGLVVHRPVEINDEMSTYGYENEVLVMIGDWYHRSAGEVLAWYTSARGFGNEPVPDSLLVNGAGRFICSMAVPARPVECVDILDDQIPNLFGLRSMNVPTRLRLVNVGTLAGVTVEMTSASLTPLTVDGGYPVSGSRSTSVGIVYPGERVDVLVEWDENVRVHSSDLKVFLDPENFKYPNHALRPNQSFPAYRQTTDFQRKSSPPLDQTSHFDLSTITSATKTEKLPPTAQQIILLYAKTQKLSIANNHPTGYINRTTWSPQSTPPLPLLALPRSQWDNNQLIPHIPISPTAETWVDIIINNLDDGAHPFHLHGHSFYVLASHKSKHGWGSYSPYSTTAAKPVLNIDYSVRKDTVSVPRRGYVIVRFKSDNGGIWMLHCHVLFHQASGMAMGIQVGGGFEHSNIDVSASSLCKKSN